MKPGVFIFDGVSSEDLHTYIQDRPLIHYPRRKVEWKSGYGTDGEIPFDEEAYENTPMELLLVVNGPSLVKSRQDLMNVIDTRGTYSEVEFYFDPGKIYRVMLGDEEIQFENKYFYGNAQAAKLMLTVKPYKYLIDSKEHSTTSKEAIITNPTNYTSQPIIRLEGSGDVTIKVNGVEFKIRDMPNKLTINSERYISYTEGATGPIQNMNSKIVSREYPLLKPGVNNISVTGSVTKWSIDPRWRSLV